MIVAMLVATLKRRNERKKERRKKESGPTGAAKETKGKASARIRHRLGEALRLWPPLLLRQAGW